MIVNLGKALRLQSCSWGVSAFHVAYRSEVPDFCELLELMLALIACNDEISYLLPARCDKSHAGIYASPCCATLLVYRAHDSVPVYFCLAQKGMGLRKQ